MQNGHLTQTTEKRLMIVSGEGFPQLAEKIADRLDVNLGGVHLETFPNGEVYARYLESVRGADVFIVQSLCDPVNDNLMELLVMIDAPGGRRRRGSCGNPLVRLLAPGPQDQAARADHGQAVAQHDPGRRAERVMTMDLHVGQIEGFFSFPVDHLTAMHSFVDHFRDRGFMDADDAGVVAPDTGEAKLASRLADHLGLPWAIVNKMRDSRTARR
jgi:ribose-phosphate pyrophosphokinase